jgi:hypothetical protein
VLQHPVSFRDDLEALGYTLLMLSNGTLPWSAHTSTVVPAKSAAQHGRTAAELKRTALPDALAAVVAAPLRDALRRYFAALLLERPGDNAARFDYAALKVPFLEAFSALTGGSRFDGTLGPAVDFAAVDAGAAAGGSGGGGSGGDGGNKTTTATAAEAALGAPVRLDRRRPPVPSAAVKLRRGVELPVPPRRGGMLTRSCMRALPAGTPLPHHAAQGTQQRNLKRATPAAATAVRDGQKQPRSKRAAW